MFLVTIGYNFNKWSFQDIFRNRSKLKVLNSSIRQHRIAKKYMLHLRYAFKNVTLFNF